ncbi:MAG TPA: hypothetical protein VFE50_21790 [Cyclobacteriaceae bacterium]|nr:hypothetical protein [Cyclobacteriaceae bacterium]
MNLRLPIFLVFVTSFAFAQEISIQNTNPTTLKWYEIKTPNFNILYPQGFDTQAQRVANTLEYIREPEAQSMGVKPRRISILLQNQSSVSNGFVTLAPRRSEFYTMPPQNYNFIGTNDWLSLLASHEYRHIVQYQRSVTGFNKFVYYLFGQNALSVVAFAAAPQWFWEGDAVATETAFTKSGRGRIPNFGLLFRTNLMEGRTFNYDRQYLRSYKNNIPDHYVFGYHMITYLRNRSNDPDIWEKITSRSWRYPFIPFGFTRSVKKETGVSVSKLYQEMADSLRKSWDADIKEQSLTKFKTLNRRGHHDGYMDYEYPQPQEDGSIIALKTGIGQIAKLVRIKEGSEIAQFVIGPYNDAGMLSAVDGRVVWNEYRYDPRWRVKNFSIVRGFDFGSRDRDAISKKSRYGSAALSPDGSKVATVESTNEYQQRLLVLDYSSGAVIKTFDNPENFMISMPRWTPDGSAILVNRLTKDGKTISTFDYNTGQVRDVFNAGNENVGHPVMSPDGKFILFNSPFSGIDNIYALDIATGKRYQVTNSKYGAYNPSFTFDKDWIVYNEQTRDGLDIVSTAFEPSLWKDASVVATPEDHFYDKLVTQESHPDIMKGVPESKFPTNKYNRLKSMINIHSWGPFFESDVTRADIGVQSRNLLGTMNVNAGYLFDINERTGNFHANVSYQGLYPVIDAGISTGKRESKTSIDNNRDVKFTWDETTVTGGLRIPLLLTASRFNTTLTVGNVVGVTQVSNFRNQVTRDEGSGATKRTILVSSGTDRIISLNDSIRFIYDNQIGNGTLLYNQFTFSFSNFLKTSRRDFNPRWAQLLDVELYNTPYSGDFKGSLAAFRSALYFPGLAKHHSVILRGGYQTGTDGFEVNRYSFRNRIGRPRGFTYPRDTEFTSLSFNYALPIWYPDINLGPVVNIQRLRANAFYDFGQSGGRTYYYDIKNNSVLYQAINRRYDSVGAEFTVDVNVMRLLPQLDLGVRVTYANPEFLKTLNPTAPAGRVVVEFVLGTLNL